MKGRKPTPVEIRQAEGNPGKRPLPAPVSVKRGVPVKPDTLPPEASAAWDAVVPALAEVGVVDAIDGMALAALVVAHARRAQATAMLEEQGIVVMQTAANPKTGELYETRPMVNPAVKIERDASLELLRLAEHYGLTPVARVRLGLSELKRRTLQQELASMMEAG